MKPIQYRKYWGGKMSEENESIKEAKFDTIDKILTMMIFILGLSVIAPIIIASIHTKEVALVSMLLEQDLDPQFFIILSGLVGTLTGKQIGKIN